MKTKKITKRKHENKKNNQNTPPPYIIFILPKYILQFKFVKYKTQKRI